MKNHDHNVFNNELLVYCNKHEKRIRLKNENSQRVKDPNTQIYFSINDILTKDYNCQPFFFTLTFKQDHSLEQQWQHAANIIQLMQETLQKEFLIVGGIISLEPHKNSTLKNKKRKNYRAGMPHAHAVIWFFHMFLNPSIQKLKLKLFNLGVAAKINELKTNLDTTKAILYTIKDREESPVRNLCEEYANWPASTQVWIAHQEPEHWFLNLHNAIGQESAFANKTFNKERQIPTTKKHLDDALLLAELFNKLFLAYNLAVKDGLVYTKIDKTRFSWRLVSSLDNWLANTFNIKHPPEYLVKLKENLLWIAKQGATTKGSFPLNIFPKLRPQMFLIEFQDTLYNFTEGTTVNPDLIDQSTQTLCFINNKWNDTKPPLKLLGLFSILVAWGLPFSDIGYPQKADLHTDRFLRSSQEHAEESFFRVIEALQAFGGLFHPEINRKINPALLIKGDPSSFKTFIILTILKGIFGLQNIDTISRSMSRFNLSKLRKDQEQPFILLMDDLRWNSLGMHLPDFLNLTDGNIVSTEKKFESSVVAPMKGTIAITTNDSMDSIVQFQDRKAIQTRVKEIHFYPLRIEPPLAINRRLIAELEEEAVSFALLANSVFLKKTITQHNIIPVLPDQFFRKQPIDNLLLENQGHFTLKNLLRELQF